MRFVYVLLMFLSTILSAQENAQEDTQKKIDELLASLTPENARSFVTQVSQEVHKIDLQPDVNEMTLKQGDRSYQIPLYGRDTQSVLDYSFILDHCDEAIPENYDNSKILDRIINKAKTLKLPVGFIASLRGKIDFKFNQNDAAARISAVAAFNPLNKTIFFRFDESSLEDESNFPLMYHELWHAYFELAINPSDKEEIMKLANEYYKNYVIEGETFTPLEKIISKSTELACKRTLPLTLSIPMTIVDEAIGEYFQNYVNTYLMVERLKSQGRTDFSKMEPIFEKARQGKEIHGYVGEFIPEEDIQPEIVKIIVPKYLEGLKF